MITPPSRWPGCCIRGSAGPDTAADHLRLLGDAITALPPALRRKLMIIGDGADASHALVKELERLASRHGYQVTYSVGWELAARETTQARSASATQTAAARTSAAPTGPAG